MSKININVLLYKIQKISGWLLLIMLIIYFISGYAMAHKYGMNAIMTRKEARFWHGILACPFFIAIFAHIFPSIYFAFKNPQKLIKRLFG